MKNWLRKTVSLWCMIPWFAGCVPVQKAPGVHDQSEALRLIDQGTALMRVGDIDQAEALPQTRPQEPSSSPQTWLNYSFHRI